MDRSRHVALSVTVAVLACIACQPAGNSTEEDVAAINEVRGMEAEGVNSGDAERALEPYTDNVAFMAPNAPLMTGKEAVRSWFSGAMEQFDVSVNYTFSDVQVAGDWAVERYAGTATFTPKDGSDAMVEQIKGIHVYQRQADGTWKIAQDIWNSDAAPPGM